ncbi:hypothetical protein ACWGCW_24325 [Streptomyces sp. NPDC054933]
MGAERTARATQQQLRSQAEAEHVHWLRQQRLKAYEAFMGAFDNFARTATASRQACEERRARAGQPGRRGDLLKCMLSVHEVDAIGDTVRVLVEQAARISVVGPPSMGECAARLTTSAGAEHARYVRQRQRASDETLPLADLAQVVAALPGDKEIHAQTENRERFLTTARQVLHSPPALDSML